MPSAEFQQIRKGGSGASRPLSAPCAKKSMQHVTFVDRYTVPRHPPGGHVFRQGGHATVKDSCTQWNQEDSWEAQRQSLAAVRHSATRTASERKFPQTRESKKAILLRWYTRTYTKSERAMLATWATKNDLAPMPDFVPPPKAAPKTEPPDTLGKRLPSKNKSWQSFPLSLWD